MQTSNLAFAMTKLSQQRGSQRSKFRTQLKKKGWPEGDAFDAEVSRLIILWEQGEAYSVQSPPECFAQVRSADPAASGLCHEALKANLIATAML